ncbi:MAG: hypothetical protein WCC84_08300 [Candidatus Cybelea sp.]
MKISRLVPYVVGGLATLSLLAACGSGDSQSSVLGTSALSPDRMATLGHRVMSKSDIYLSVRPFKVHKDHRKSWVAPDIRRAPRLLFIADAGTDDLYIFTMPALALRATITGLDGPNGECTDRSGNVWVANTDALDLLQYSRGGVLLNTLSDEAGYPVGCAVDPRTGNLAVTNYESFLDYGQVLIYPNATSPPTEEFRNREIQYPFFPAYDLRGNLYVNGLDFGGNYILSELAAGSDTLSTVNVSGGTLYFPGMVQWNIVGRDLVLGDQFCNASQSSCIYSATVSGSTVMITGMTQLMNYEGGSICDMVQGALTRLGRTAAAGGFFTCGTPSTVNRWLFPSGGMPTNYNNSVVSAPIGAAISNR